MSRFKFKLKQHMTPNKAFIFMRVNEECFNSTPYNFMREHGVSLIDPEADADNLARYRDQVRKEMRL